MTAESDNSEATDAAITADSVATGANTLNDELNPTGQPVAKVDLSKYPTGPLVEQISNLISVPAAFRRIMLTMLIVMLAAPHACAFIMPMEELSGLLKTGVYSYAMIAGMGFGILFGILRVISIGMRSVQEILNIIPRITGQAATDYAQLQTGNMRMPTGGELMEQVYDEVVLPTVEKVASSAFGFLGTPLFWAYRRTLG